MIKPFTQFIQNARRLWWLPAFVAFILGWFTFMVRYQWLPGGYVTDYDKAIKTPWLWMGWIQYISAIYFWILSNVGCTTRLRLILAIAALVALPITFVIEWQILPWYFGSYLRLDDGIGG